MSKVLSGGSYHFRYHNDSKAIHLDGMGLQSWKHDDFPLHDFADSMDVEKGGLGSFHLLI